jgi:hypothetical protein
MVPLSNKRHTLRINDNDIQHWKQLCCILAMSLNTKSIARIIHPSDLMPLIRVQLRYYPFHALFFSEQPNFKSLLSSATLSYAQTETLSSLRRSV